MRHAGIAGCYLQNRELLLPCTKANNQRQRALNLGNGRMAERHPPPQMSSGPIRNTGG